MARLALIVLAGVVALTSAGCATGETGSTVSLNGSGATVDGRVASNVGGPVQYWVQYGTTQAYGSETQHATVSVQPNTPTIVFVTIAPLARETEYHYRLCASDSQQGSGGPGCGADRTLVTESALCNQTITSSIRLTADVICSVEDGAALIVGADGIDINLAGHRVGVPVFVGGGQLAISNDGHSDVTVRNGTVDGRIDVANASRNLIRDVHASSTGTVINVEGGSATEIRANDLDGRGSAVRVESDDVVVANNDATSSLGAAISVIGERARIVRNRVPAGAPNFLTGIQLLGSNGRIVDNRVTGPWLAGGIVLGAGGNDVIAENEVSDIRFPSGPDPQFGDGIVVNAFTAGTLLRDNLAQRNDGDGIEVRATNARLRNNSAFDNRLLGINAVAGVTDEGGNRAHGNGTAAQCLNVACSP
jgi:parallel beta-helix repeat protein